MRSISFFFFFNDTATTEIYTLSLHDALPICLSTGLMVARCQLGKERSKTQHCSKKKGFGARDRKSTRLNSSHLVISYAVFCLKKKKATTYKIAVAQWSRDTPYVVSIA